ncbi:GtrA family protein [Spirulina sp. 06S082]|uniref:GtrA family protein n=1 Tax=Spirulina sp. 06S082 TaxID=3110248 RepID=UPI002B21FD44|nr:GtrA family protein [Spirulina sp. 06S082]MEA5469047.1 GtrA family protein [Spirulina sp. 06S082]
MLTFYAIVLAKLKNFSPKTLMNNTMVRWWIVGLAFMGLNIPLLYFAIELFHLPAWFAALTTSELANILRFFINDRWVFGFPRPTWKRFGEYHIAIAGSFIVWTAIYNFLVYGVDIEQITVVPFILDTWEVIIAPVIATTFSVFVNMLTNFLWIWRNKE